MPREDSEPRDTADLRVEGSPLRRSWIHTGSGVAYGGPLEAKSLGRGTPGFYGPRTPDAARFAPAFKIEGRPLKYPPATGTRQLRSLIAEYLRRLHQREFREEQVIVCNGGTQAINVALNYAALMSPGRLRCGFLTPTWLGLPSNQVQLLGGSTIEVPSLFTGSGWQTNKLLLTSLILKRALDVLFVVNPSNPTGGIVTEESAALPLLFSRAVPCILDVTYDAMVYGPAQPLIPADYGRHFIVGSLSKTFAVPGIRVGFLVPPLEAQETCAQIVEATTMGVSMLSQEYAVSSLEDWLRTGARWFQPVMSELQARRDLTLSALGRAGFACARPRAGYYVFAQLPVAWAGQAVEFCKALQKTAGVEVVPGIDFGGDYGSFVRISFANPGTRAELAESLKRIEQFLGEEVLPKGAPSESRGRAIAV